MMASYLIRLFCLCLAVFFVVHSVAGLLVSLGASSAVRGAGRLRPRSAGRFLLVLRLLPATLALLVVAGICVPSYLWLEPEVSAEEVGAGCLTAAILAAVLWLASSVRGLRAIARSAQNTRECERLCRPSTVPGTRLQVWILDSPTPLLALVGLFRSRVLISSPVMSTLTAEQLAAALRHEEAHRVSRDNVKRLLLLLTPGLLPGFHGFDLIERGWARFTEWAADDEAVDGDARRSLSLAAALVRVARMGGTTALSPLTASFLGDSSEISARVDRLLNPAPAAPARSHNSAAMAAGVALATVCAGAMLNRPTASLSN